MKRFLPLVLVVMVVAAYANSWAAPFTYDDKIEVIGNAAVRDLGNPAAFVLYNPARAVVLATYAANWAFGEFDPRGYHAVSIGLHALNAVLAFFLARRLVSPGRALFAAAAWALHPMTTEGVTYISGRSDALVATWFFAATALWIDDSRTPDVKKRVGAWVIAAVALVTKETAIVLPLVLFAADWLLVAGKRRELIAWRRYVPLVLFVLGAGVGRVLIVGWPVPEVPRPIGVHVVSQGEAWGHYLQLWLVPWGQSILQAMPSEATPVGALCLLAFGVAGFLAFRAGGVTAFAAALWVLPLGLTSAFVLKETMAEHRAYLAGFGLWLFIASRVPDRRAYLLIPLILAGLTVRRNLDWKDEITLWAGASARWPESVDAAKVYGQSLKFAHRCAEAIPVLERALTLDSTRVDILDDLGICHADQHHDAEARASWELALKIAPGHCAALNNLAGLRLRDGDRAGAASGYGGTLRVCPDDPIAHFNLGMLYLGAHEADKSISHLESYLRVDPGGPYVDRANKALRKLGAGPLPTAPAAP